MRNPFARFAKRDAARPSLRERAASLNASASRVIRREPVDTAPAALAIRAAAVDPIFAVIAETQRLAVARTVAAQLPQPAGTIDPLPEQEAAADAFYAHVDDVLLKMVPTSAAGCSALARYAVEFLEAEGFALDEDQGNDQHVRILDLIARSPLLGGAPLSHPPVPDFSAMSVDDLRRTYDAFKIATDVMGLTGWTTSQEGVGDRLLDSEAEKLSRLQSYIVDELRRRTPANRFEAIARADTLISHEVACGSYDCAAAAATEAHTRRLY